MKTHFFSVSRTSSFLETEGLRTVWNLRPQFFFFFDGMVAPLVAAQAVINEQGFCFVL